MRFSADGARLYCAGAGPQLLEADSGKRIWQRDGDASALAVCPEERSVAVMGFFGDVEVLEADSGKLRFGLDPQRADAALDFLDADTLACASVSAIACYDARRGTELTTQDGHLGEIRRVVVADDGRLAVSASIDHSTRLWDVEGAREVVIAEHDNTVDDVAIAPDASLWVSTSADDTVRVWRASDGRQEAVFRTNPMLSDAGVALSPQGESVAYTTRGAVVVLRLEDRQSIAQVGCDEPLRVAFLDDTTLVILEPKRLSIVDYVAQTARATRPGDYSKVLALAPDRSLLAVRDSDALVLLDSRRLEVRRPIPAFLAVDAAFSRAGVLAVAPFDAPVLLWDLGAGQSLGRLHLEGRASALAFVNDRKLLVGFRDGSLETVEVPLTERQQNAARQRERSERESVVLGLMRELGLRTTSGYRNAERRGHFDPDGLGLRLPELAPLDVHLRGGATETEFALELRIGSAELPPPPSSFARLGASCGSAWGSTRRRRIPGMRRFTRSTQASSSAGWTLRAWC